jgi:hypothetical protein
MVRPSLAVALTAIMIGCSAPAVSSNSLLSANIGQEGGNAQTGVVGTLLPDSLAVGVQDSSGFPVSGLSVTFTTTGGALISGCSCQTQVETTDSSGRAHVTIVLGTAVGTDSVVATPANFLYPLVAIFTEIATADNPAVLTILSGNNQVASRGSLLALPLVVMVSDRFGNGVPGAMVNWTASADGTITPSMSLSDSLGRAQAAWGLPTSTTTDSVTAQVNGTMLRALFTGQGN